MCVRVCSACACLCLITVFDYFWWAALVIGGEKSTCTIVLGVSYYARAECKILLRHDDK